MGRRWTVAIFTIGKRNVETIEICKSISPALRLPRRETVAVYLLLNKDNLDNRKISFVSKRTVVKSLSGVFFLTEYVFTKIDA